MAIGGNLTAVGRGFNNGWVGCSSGGLCGKSAGSENEVVNAAANMRTGAWEAKTSYVGV